jgi:glycosyltransferase involved in cell wall biosynthesis
MMREQRSLQIGDEIVMHDSLAEEYVSESLDRRMPTSVSLPYLLVIEQQLPFYRDRTGQLFVDELWHKDLLMHLGYLDQLMIASPCREQAPPPDAKPLPTDKSTFQVVELPAQKSFVHSLLVMPTILARLSRAIRNAGIVHSAIAGWPIPMGWVVTPLALIFRKPLVIVVESAPWRLQHGQGTGWKRRWRAAIQEFMARWVLRNASLVICTQEDYCRSLLGPESTNGFVIPASWIDEEDILPEYVAEDTWQRKLSDSDSRLKLLFVGRLVPAKGLLVLLQALRRLSKEFVPISLDILGDGDLKSQCELAASELKGITAVNLLGTVPYGAPLFELIRGYDAIVVPCISDEQPRVVFDAYSQAVPVLASDTPGLRSCVKSGELGLFAAPNDVSALADLLRYCATHRTELKRMGMHSLKYAHSMTHQEMHRRRAELLHTMIDAKERPNACSVIEATDLK